MNTNFKFGNSKDKQWPKAQTSEPLIFHPSPTKESNMTQKMLQSNFVIKAPYPEKDLKEHANKTTMYSQTYRHTTDDVSVKADHRIAPKFETHFSLGSETDRKTSEAKANFHHNRSLTRQYDWDTLQKKNSQT